VVLAIRACRDRGNVDPVSGPSVTVRRRLVSGGYCNVVVAVMLESRLRVLLFLVCCFACRRVYANAVGEGEGGGRELAAGKSCNKSAEVSVGGGVNSVVRVVWGGAEERLRDLPRIGCLVCLNSPLLRL